MRAAVAYSCRMDHATFRLNGSTVALDGADATESLLRWLRRQHLTGTKEGCADGDCGACTVALIEPDASGSGRLCAVNSCLFPMGQLPGREVLTVEALSDGDTLHPVQAAMVDCAGSQCGYCTPGFVMSLFVGWHDGELGDHATEGNLCRCTGYRPIRAAAALLASQRTPDRFTDATAARRAPLPAAALGTFHNPTTLAEAFALKSQQPQAAWIAGGTDLGVTLSRWQGRAPAYIALDRIAELQTIERGAHSVRIGAGVPLACIETELAGVFPALDAMLPWFAARQVRNRATFGGNLGSASPIGDLLPVLLAHDATIHCAGPNGLRDIAADAFFLDYRKTARHDDELVLAVTLPHARGASTSMKVAKRQTDDISIVAASFAVELDAERRVRFVRLAYGGVAAIPTRAVRSEALLLGEVLDTPMTERIAQ